MANPMYQLLGIPDPTPGAGYDQYFASVPDTSWIQARGIMPQTQTGNMGYPQQQPVGYPTGQPQMMGGPQMDPTQNPYALAQKAYEDSHIQKLNALDITKPTYARDAEEYLLNQPDQSLATNQRVQSAYKSALTSHKELQSYFQKDPKAAQTYANLVKQGKSPDEAIGTLRQQTAQDEQNYKLGLLAADNGLDPAQFQDKNGNVNELALHSAVFNRKQAASQTRIPLSKDDREEFKASMQAIKDAQELDTSSKDMVAKKQALITGGQAKDWNDADALLRKQATQAAIQEHQALVHTYDGSNYALSPMYYTAGGMDVPAYHSTGRGKIQMTMGGQQGPAAQSPAADLASGPQWGPAPAWAQGPQPATVPSSVPGPAPVVTDAIPMQPGDLTRNDLYNPPAPQTGFSGLTQQIAEDQSNARLEAAASAAAAQKEAATAETINRPQWENAKQELLKNFKPDYARWGVGDNNALTAALGKKPTEVVFHDASGRAVTWGEVTRQLMNDPRMDAIRHGKVDPSPIKAVRLVSK